MAHFYKDANTQVIQGNYGTVTGRVECPVVKLVAGVIAGGMAERGSQILTRRAESEPYKQVEVYQHEVVSILFVDPVMTNDARSSSLSSGISPSVNRYITGGTTLAGTNADSHGAKEKL